jgi:hypothetical protein
MTDGLLSGEDLEGRSSGLMEVLSRYLSRATEVIHRKNLEVVGVPVEIRNEYPPNTAFPLR